MDALESDELRDLGIGVQTGECVFAVRQRVHNGVVRVQAGIVQVFAVARDGINVRQHFRHSAVFHVEQAFAACIGKALHQRTAPIGESRQNVAGGRIAAIQPCIAQAGHILVDRVEWRPVLVDSFDLIGADICLQFAGIWKGYQ